MNQLYQIPNPVTSFGVTCAIGQYVMDSDDSGKEPDLIAIGGSVEITPNLKTPIRIDTDPPRVASHDTMYFSIDPTTGQLVHPDGTVGIELINSRDELLTPKGWSYTATIRPDKGKTWSVTFVGPPEGSDSIDLALVAPVDPNPGVVIPLDPSFYLTKDEAQRDYAKKNHTHTAEQVAFQNGSDPVTVQAILEAQALSLDAQALALTSLDGRVTTLENSGGGGGGGETLDTGIRSMVDVWKGHTFDVTWYVATLQRIGSLVMLTYVVKFNNATNTPTYIVPPGFRATPGHNLSMITQYIAGQQALDSKVSLLQQRERLIMGGTDQTGPTYGTALWVTTDTWPTDLPGTPVNPT